MWSGWFHVGPYRSLRLKRYCTFRTSVIHSYQLARRDIANGCTSGTVGVESGFVREAGRGEQEHGECVVFGGVDRLVVSAGDEVSGVAGEGDEVSWRRFRDCILLQMEVDLLNAEKKKGWAEYMKAYRAKKRKESDEKRRRILDAESGAVDRKPRAGGKRAAGGVVDAELPKPAVVAQVAAGERGAKTGNRRNRADYNAYMKWYMAKKRKKKDASGGDELGTPTLE